MNNISRFSHFAKPNLHCQALLVFRWKLNFEACVFTQNMSLNVRDDETDIAFYTKHIINFSSPAIWYAIGTTILRLRPRRTATRDPRWQLFIPFPVLPVLPLLRACGHAEPQVKSVEAIIFLTSAGPSAITYLARTRTAIRRMVRSVPEE